MAHFTKEQFLATPMNQLFPECHTFNRWFTRDGGGGNVPLDSIPTLRQFIAANSLPLKNTDLFVLGDGSKTFSKQSASFAKLRKLLLISGFTTKDWIVLANTRQLRLFSMQILKSRHNIIEIPFFLACNLKCKSATYLHLAVLCEAKVKDIHSVSVARLLLVTQYEVNAITGTSHPWNMDYDEVQCLRRVILSAKRKLRTLGFTEDDGPFMSISFKKEKKGRASRRKKTVAESTRFYIEALEAKHPHREYRYKDSSA